SNNGLSLDSIRGVPLQVIIRSREQVVLRDLPIDLGEEYPLVAAARRDPGLGYEKPESCAASRRRTRKQPCRRSHTIREKVGVARLPVDREVPPLLIVTEKPEQLVFDYRSAKSPPKLLAPVRRVDRRKDRRAVRIKSGRDEIQRISRIQRSVTNVVKAGSM